MSRSGSYVAAVVVIGTTLQIAGCADQRPCAAYDQGHHLGERPGVVAVRSAGCGA